MFSYSACYAEKPIDANAAWLSTEAVDVLRYKPKCCRISFIAIESIILIAAIAIIVSQLWGTNLSVQHSIIAINATLIGLCGFDILIALSLVLYKYLQRSPTSVAATSIASSQSDGWKGLHYVPDYSLQNIQAQNIQDCFIKALEKNKVSSNGYRFIIFRRASPSCPALIGYDGVANGLFASGQRDNNPNNLSNYTSQEILVVTYFDWHREYEKVVIRDPFHGSYQSHFQGCTYVHLNHYDLVELKEKQELSNQILNAINNHRTWQAAQTHEIQQ